MKIVNHRAGTRTNYELLLRQENRSQAYIDGHTAGLVGNSDYRRPRLPSQPYLKIIHESPTMVVLIAQSSILDAKLEELGGKYKEGTSRYQGGAWYFFATSATRLKKDVYLSNINAWSGIDKELEPERWDAAYRQYEEQLNDFHQGYERGQQDACREPPPTNPFKRR